MNKLIVLVDAGPCPSVDTLARLEERQIRDFHELSEVINHVANCSTCRARVDSSACLSALAVCLYETEKQPAAVTTC